MPGLTKDQIRHEVINLRKTFALLERYMKEEDWERCTSKDRLDKYLKAQTILSVSRAAVCSPIKAYRWFTGHHTL